MSDLSLAASCVGSRRPRDNRQASSTPTPQVPTNSRAAIRKRIAFARLSLSLRVHRPSLPSSSEIVHLGTMCHPTRFDMQSRSPDHDPSHRRSKRYIRKDKAHRHPSAWWVKFESAVAERGRTVSTCRRSSSRQPASADNQTHSSWPESPVSA